ncbi:hypothetical protein AMI01nite_26060 [Aneurinibacillus migulanus]|nr:hypothetical protein AMI01nite_26060 [Aneurinibacillus migulanus]
MDKQGPFLAKNYLCSLQKPVGICEDDDKDYERKEASIDEQMVAIANAN